MFIVSTCVHEEFTYLRYSKDVRYFWNIENIDKYVRNVGISENEWYFNSVGNVSVLENRRNFGNVKGVNISEYVTIVKNLELLTIYKKFESFIKCIKLQVQYYYKGIKFYHLIHLIFLRNITLLCTCSWRRMCCSPAEWLLSRFAHAMTATVRVNKLSRYFMHY